MAESRIEPRRRDAWLWVIGLVVLMLLLWGMAQARGRQAPQVRNDATRVGTVRGVAPAPTTTVDEKSASRERLEAMRLRTRVVA